MSSERSRIKYTKLKKDDITAVRPRDKIKKRYDEYYDDQFDDTVPIKVPIKSICIAIILFILGSVMLTLGSLMLAGVLNQGGGSFRAAPLMVIGSIIFIPGAYNVKTAYYAWKGYHGYSYADIAGFGEDH